MGKQNKQAKKLELNPSAQEVEEIKASLVYIKSSRPGRAA